MDRFSKPQARELADRLFKGGAYRFTYHVEDRGRERNIDLLDVGYCLENGEIFDEPRKYEKPVKEWRYKIQGPDIEGDEIIVETESGSKRTLTITDSTRIELEDDLPGNLLDLREGMEVKVKFNPSTNVALKIEVED